MNSDVLQLQAEIAISKIENSRLVTSELIRLGIAIGKGNRIESVIEFNKKRHTVQVKMVNGISFYFC